MRLFLIRHAPAKARQPGDAESDRPLSRRGRRRWRRALRGLVRTGLRFDRLYHSPWLRAVHTAEPLRVLVDDESLVLGELLGVPGPALLLALRGERVAAVGHEPWLTQLAAILVFGDVALHRRLSLKRGGLLVLDGELRPAGMQLRGLFPPRLLRAAGG
jgi:phosphohistidine phosphatase